MSSMFVKGYIYAYITERDLSFKIHFNDQYLHQAEDTKNTVSHQNFKTT